MTDFKPPLYSPTFTRLCKTLLPIGLMMGRVKLKVVGDGVARYKALAGKRVVVCPRHSHPMDPVVVFAFSKEVGDDFAYISARETFDWLWGLNGFVQQHVGCYSIKRGARDEQSFEMTRRVVAEGKQRLVIFPEGEVSNRDDILLPIRSGAVRLLFEAQEFTQANHPGEPVLVLPLAINYVPTDTSERRLSRTLAGVEFYLGINPSASATLQSRLQEAARALLGILEREYQHETDPNQALSKRMDHLRETVLLNMANYLGVREQLAGSHLDWVRHIRIAIDETLAVDEQTLSPYERSVHYDKVRSIKTFYRTLDRMVRLMTIYDHYNAHQFGPEEMSDIVDVLEMEMVGHVKAGAHRTALLQVGEPINVLDFLPSYRTSSKSAIAEVAREISGEYIRLLSATGQQAKIAGIRKTG